MRARCARDAGRDASHRPVCEIGAAATGFIHAMQARYTVPQRVAVAKSRIESSLAEAFRPSLESVSRGFPAPSIRRCAKDFRDHWRLDASATMFGTTAGWPAAAVIAYTTTTFTTA
jgi:hypothetical protein